MQEPPHPPSKRREDQGEEEEAHQEEGDLRQDGDQDPDHPEDEEHDSPDDVPDLASPFAAGGFRRGMVRATGGGGPGQAGRFYVALLDVTRRRPSRAVFEFRRLSRIVLGRRWAGG